MPSIWHGEHRRGDYTIYRLLRGLPRSGMGRIGLNLLLLASLLVSAGAPLARAGHPLIQPESQDNPPAAARWHNANTGVLPYRVLRPAHFVPERPIRRAAARRAPSRAGVGLGPSGATAPRAGLLRSRAGARTLAERMPYTRSLSAQRQPSASSDVPFGAVDNELGINQQPLPGGGIHANVLSPGGFVEYPIPSASSGAYAIANGPDGNLWFTEISSNNVARVTPTGTITEFPIPYRDPTYGIAKAYVIARGPDGNNWFTEFYGDHISSITPAGTVTEYTLPNGSPGRNTSADPLGVTSGPDGNVYFTEYAGNKIGRINPGTHAITEWRVPTGSPGISTSSLLENIVAGADGDLWFCEAAGNKIGRLNATTGVITEFAVPTASAGPYGIASGADGNLWFTETNASQIGRITLVGAITEFPVAADTSGPQLIAGGLDGNLYFTQLDQIARITLQGSTSTFALPTAGSGTNGITMGPDGNLWFTEVSANQVGVLGVPSGPGTPETLGPSHPDENAPYCQGGANPVNCATGDFWHSFDDLVVPGRGIALHLTHGYNSLVASQDGPLGFGWAESYNLFLSKDTGGIITMHTEGGAQIPFLPAGSGYIAPGRVFSRLTVNGDMTLTTTRKDRTQLIFAAPAVGTPGQLLREIDRNGYATSLTYASGKLSTVADPAGRSLSFFYNASGRIDHVIDPANRTVSFQYNDGVGNLTDAYDVANGHWHFTYDAGHLLLTMTDPVQEPLAQPKAVVNVYYADGSGRVQSQTDQMARKTTYGYVANADGSQTTTITDPKSNVTVQQYAQNLLLSLTKGYGTPQAATWTYTYDPATLGIGTVTDPNLHVWKNRWDASGNLLSSTDPLQRTSSYTYDAFSDVTSVTDAAAVTKYLQYDSRGNLISVSQPLNTLPATMTPTATATATGTPSATPTAVSLNEFALAAGSGPAGDVAGPDGNLWYTEPGTNKIGQIAPSGTIVEFGIPTAGASPQGIAAGPDGNLWFAETGTSKIAKITTGGVITEFALAAGSAPYGIAAGPDGNLWFTEGGTAKIGRITTAGTITQYALATGSSPRGITVGADGNLWFVENGASAIGRISTGGTVSTYALPAGSQPASIAAGSDGNLWYTEPGTTRVGHISTAGVRGVEVSLAAASQPAGISTGPDGNLWVAEAGTNALARITTAGSLTEFPLFATGSGPAGIARGADGNLWVTESQGSRLGRVLLLISTILGYDAAHPGDLTGRTDGDGHTWLYGYDPLTGNLLSIKDPLGNTVTRSYDAAGRVQTQVSPDGNGPTATPAAYTTTYGYSAFGDVTSITDPLLPGQATPGVTTLRYDPNRNRVSAQDANGYTTQYQHDADNELTGVILPLPTTSPTAVQSSISYDSDGNVQSRTDFDGRTISYGHDPLDRLASISQPVTQPVLGAQTRLTQMSYDGAGNRIVMTDPLGHVTQYGYDPANQQTSTSQLNAQGTPVAVTGTGYDPLGNVRSATDANNHTTSYQTDSLGRRIGVVDPLGRLTATILDPLGNLLLTTDPAAHGVATGYDNANRAILTTNADASTISSLYDADGNVTSSTDENRHTTTYAYNALDWRTSMTDARGKRTSYGYDAAGNRTSLQLPLNPATIYGYDQIDRLISAKDPINPAATYGYDGVGNKLSTSDGNGHTTRSTYDEADELVTLTQPDLSSTGFLYDMDGNVQTRTDAASHATQYRYDVLNHLQSITDPLSRLTQYVYDPVGNLKTLTDAFSPTRTTTSGYDAADQLTSIAYSDGATANVGLTYTPAGQTATMTDGTGTTTSTYDSRERLIGQVTGAGNVAGYGYDPAGNLTKITYPGSKAVSRSYDTVDRLTSVKDWLNHTTTFGYDDNANLTKISYPTSISDTVVPGYDQANGLTGIVDASLQAGKVTPFWSASYGRDSTERIGTASDPAAGGVLHTYTRNALDQLTTDARSGAGTGNTTWSYDPAYRLLARADSAATTSSTFSPDAADQLTSLITTTSGVATQSRSYGFNNNGDRTGWTDSVAHTSATFGYDQANRMTTYGSGAASASYGYDGAGLRMSRTVGGVAAQFTWDEAQGLPLLLQEGSTRYIDGPNGLPVEQVDSIGNVRYYLHDQLGSVKGLLDPSGTLTDSYSYDALGARTAVTGSLADTPFGYAGQYTDAETGFQYLRARYYDPATGQFLSRDPLALPTGHPYAYAAGDPTDLSDPSGLCPSLIPDIVCGAVSGVSGYVASAGTQAVNGYNQVRDNARNSQFGQGLYAGLYGSAVAAATLYGAAVNSTVACLDPYTQSDCDQQWRANFATASFVAHHPFEAAFTAVYNTVAPIAYIIACKDGAYTIGYVIGTALPNLLTNGLLRLPLDDVTAGCFCFPADTAVDTPHGMRAIAGLHVGDLVQAEDPRTGKVEAEPVLAVIDDGVKPLLAVGLSDGSTVRVTANHPFWVDSGAALAAPGWLPAGELRAGDRLRTEDGRDVAVLGIREGAGSAHVYTLTVARDHAFFAGSAGVLVHNAGPINCKFANGPFVANARVLANHPDFNIDYPDSVQFNASGYPSFSRYAKYIVRIRYTGTRPGDFAAANRAAGLASTPKGWTWHHHEDGMTMELVPEDLHGAARHTGGFSIGGNPGPIQLMLPLEYTR